jgi:hypothetical protein
MLTRKAIVSRFDSFTDQAVILPCKGKMETFWRGNRPAKSFAAGRVWKNHLSDVSPKKPQPFGRRTQNGQQYPEATRIPDITYSYSKYLPISMRSWKIRRGKLQ